MLEIDLNVQLNHCWFNLAEMTREAEAIGAKLTKAIVSGILDEESLAVIINIKKSTDRLKKLIADFKVVCNDPNIAKSNPDACRYAAQAHQRFVTFGYRDIGMNNTPDEFCGSVVVMLKERIAKLQTPHISTQVNRDEVRNLINLTIDFLSSCTELTQASDVGFRIAGHLAELECYASRGMFTHNQLNVCVDGVSVDVVDHITNIDAVNARFLASLPNLLKVKHTDYRYKAACRILDARLNLTKSILVGFESKFIHMLAYANQEETFSQIVENLCLVIAYYGALGDSIKLAMDGIDTEGFISFDAFKTSLQEGESK